MSRGFTLIELLFTVVVMALLVTLAAPNIQSSIRNSAMTAATNNMIASLQLARSEAIKRRLPVTICASSNSATCEDVAWDSGWIVFADINDDGTADDGEVLHIEKHMGAEREDRRTINVTLPADQPLQNSLTYLPSGFPDLGGLAAAGQMLLCDARQSDAFGRVIVISQTGRPLASVVSDRGDLGEGVTCEQ